ncbi:MAG: GtrA family protein [Clostridia bacterium]|nr:GtrA family protein [Clostridia bacterium]
MIKKLFQKYREIIMYLIFGVSTTLVNWIVYTVLVSMLNAGVTLSNGIAWFAAVSFAYITNKLYVFESKSWKASVLIREVLSFFGARIASGVFEIFLPAFLMKIGLDQAIFGIEGFAAKIVVSILVIVLNYIFSKLFVFKSKK